MSNDNANIIHLAKEDRIMILQDEELDKRIENVVRKIQGQVLQFYTQYESLHGIIQKSSDVRAELDKLDLCKSQLMKIRSLCVKEHEDFQNKKNDFRGPIQGLYERVLKDINDIIKELYEYIKNLYFIISLLRSSTSTPNDESVKKGFRMAFDILHSRYNAFIRSDENLIEALDNIKKLDSLS